MGAQRLLGHYHSPAHKNACLGEGKNLSVSSVGFRKSALVSGRSIRLPEGFDAMAAEPYGENGDGQQLLCAW